MTIETFEDRRTTPMEHRLKKWSPPVLEMIGETEDLKAGLDTVDDGPSFNTGAS